MTSFVKVGDLTPVGGGKGETYHDTSVYKWRSLYFFPFVVISDFLDKLNLWLPQVILTLQLRKKQPPPKRQNRPILGGGGGAIKFLLNGYECSAMYFICVRWFR